MFRVQTFDDIDVFVNIAVKTLSLSSMATMGLRELVVNAIEHGNLEISFDKKSELLARGAWQAEIERRLTLEKYRDRAASIVILRSTDRFSIDIIDQGPGFDWRGYVDPKTAPKSLLHGRGLLMAMDAGYDSIDYRGAGNEVVLRGVCNSPEIG